VLEAMAGYGRNVPILKEKFNNIELLDGSKEMVALMPQDVTKH
jgi:hypothetical protein